MHHALFIPYLYFKDFSQSSGVIHQAQIVKTLAQAGVHVIVVLPEPGDGWKYDFKEYFGDHELVSYTTVSMLKNQYLWTGFWDESMIRKLSPTKTDIAFDVVINMVPPLAGGIKRLLCEVGFSRLEIPVINGFDTVACPEEANIRGGNLPQYLEDLKISEVSATMQADATILTTYNEHTTLLNNVKSIVSPSVFKEVRDKVHYIPKPLILPEPEKRLPPEDGKFRIFFGKSFGKSFEDKGKQNEALIKAITYVAAKRKIQLVLCTTSDIENDWAKEQLSQLAPENLELVHRQPRSVVLDKLQSCHLAIDIRNYDGLYLAAIEQQASGAVTIFKSSKWSEGEVMPLFNLPGDKPAQIAQVIETALDHFSQEAYTAYIKAVGTVDKHNPELIGALWKGIISQHVRPVIVTEKSRAILQLAMDTHQWDGVSLEDVKDDIFKLYNMGRNPDIWLIKALEKMGCQVDTACDGQEIVHAVTCP